MNPTTNKFAIFTNEININTINIIKDFIFEKYQCDDFNIFSDVMVGFPEPTYAVLTSFYLPFYNGIVVFLSKEDYLNKKDDLINNIICYVVSDENIQNVRTISINNNRIIEL